MKKTLFSIFFVTAVIIVSYLIINKYFLSNKPLIKNETRQETKLEKMIDKINKEMIPEQRTKVSSAYPIYELSPNAYLGQKYYKSRFIYPNQKLPIILSFDNTKLKIESIEVEERGNALDITLGGRLNDGEIRFMRTWFSDKNNPDILSRGGGNYGIAGRGWSVELEKPNPKCQLLSLFVEYFVPYSIAYNPNTGKWDYIEIAQILTNRKDMVGSCAVPAVAPL